MSRTNTYHEAVYVYPRDEHFHDKDEPNVDQVADPHEDVENSSGLPECSQNDPGQCDRLW